MADYLCARANENVYISNAPLTGDGYLSRVTHFAVARVTPPSHGKPADAPRQMLEVRRATRTPQAQRRSVPRMRRDPGRQPLPGLHAQTADDAPYRRSVPLACAYAGLTLATRGHAAQTQARDGLRGPPVR